MRLDNLSLRQERSFTLGTNSGEGSTCFFETQYKESENSLNDILTQNLFLFLNKLQNE